MPFWKFWKKKESKQDRENRLYSERMVATGAITEDELKEYSDLLVAMFYKGSSFPEADRERWMELESKYAMVIEGMKHGSEEQESNFARGE